MKDFFNLSYDLNNSAVLIQTVWEISVSNKTTTTTKKKSLSELHIFWEYEDENL